MLKAEKQLRHRANTLRESSTHDELIDFVDDLLVRWEQDREDAARRIGRLTENIQVLDARLLTLENSRVFRLLQRLAGWLSHWSFKSRSYVKPENLQAQDNRAYQHWMERQRLNSPNDAWFRQAAAQFSYRPRFTLLLHLRRPVIEHLTATVHSVIAQSYSEWELCVCDDACPEPNLERYFRSLTERDSRIQYMRSEEEMGLASSLNRAAMLGSGDYIACLPSGGELSPHALFHFAQAVQKKRFDLLYADEDRIAANGLREKPCFKPGWSPDLLLGSLYIGRFFALPRTQIEAAGWFQPGCEGAELHDLALRVSEQSCTAHHVPHVLYGERYNASPAKQDQPASREGHRKAVQAAIARRGWKAAVEERPDGRFTLRRKISGTPLVSIVICSRNARLLRNCLRSIDNLTAYPMRETVVVQHRTGDDSAMDRLLAQSHCVRVTHNGPFDFATMNNNGAQAANGEILVFLNDDVEPLTADWLNELLAQVQRPEVGVVGAKLVYPSGAIQHTGLALGLMDGAGHPDRGAFGRTWWPWSSFTRNVSAVTGACLAIRRRVFEELSGFDPTFPVNYNDVDLCLRARDAGYEVLCEVAAVLRHLESRTRVRGVSWAERELFHERWGNLVNKGDPFYSPHLSTCKEDCSLKDV